MSDSERKHLKVAGNFAGAAFNLLFDVFIFVSIRLRTGIVVSHFYAE